MSERINDQPDLEVDKIVFDEKEILRLWVLAQIVKWRSDKSQYEG